MIKVLTVFGTRPEAIKMAPVVLELKRRSGEFDCVVCVTAQHREMLDQVLHMFAITPDYDLNLMKHGQTLAQVTSGVLTGLDEIIRSESPDIILVHGDTNTTMSASLAAFYHKVKLGHVEAGLRTYNKYSPFPEEINRQITGVIADLHFAPTQRNRENLLRENKSDDSIFVTGNTVIDALRTTVREDYSHEILDWASDSRLILLTAHRRENLGRPMDNIFGAVRRLADEFTDVKVVYPIHLNPEIRAICARHFENCPRIKLIEPMEALDFHNFLGRAHLILTDSGGIQEEAPSLGKPVLVLRDTTERPEGVEAGTLKLTGTDAETIYQMARTLLSDTNEYNRMAQAKNPYGDGRAAEYIADAILQTMRK